jgi:hypothetical protein
MTKPVPTSGISRRNYYATLGHALWAALAVRTTLLVNVLSVGVLLVLIFTNNEQAAADVGQLNFGIPRAWFLLPLGVLLMYDVLEAQRMAYQQVVVQRDSAIADGRVLVKALEEQKDQSFANAPLLRWQTPELSIVDGGIRFLVRCTNEGHEPARVKDVHARWSTGEPVNQISVKPETTIYVGPSFRVDFVASTSVVFGTAWRTVSWSITYADNAGKSYDTDCQATCYLDTQFSVGEVTDRNLDDESTAKDRHERHVARAG